MAAIVTLPHLPPMTRAEFDAYQACEQAHIAANKASYRFWVAAGASAFARGAGIDDFPAGGTDAAARDAWRHGWSEARGPISSAEFFSGAAVYL